MEKMIDDYGNSEVIVRVIPLPGDANILAGLRGFRKEMNFRRERNKQLSKEAQFPIYNWEDLEIYFDGRNV